MSGNSMGEKLRVTVFGQSHAPGIGAVVEGYPSGRAIDWAQVDAFMARRAPGQGALASARKEADKPEILSGLNDRGLTCGTPICALIRNQDARREDYEHLRLIPRPGHADYAAFLKDGEHWDGRGGGPYSGRMTAPLCFAGALALQWLEEKGVKICAHIANIGPIRDGEPDALFPRLPLYGPGDFPVIDPTQGEEMKREIARVQAAGDSVGGSVRCLVTGFPGGLGGPLFAGLEGKLAQALFAIPAVKGVEFGAGFRAAQGLGSQNNDGYRIREGKLALESNHAGGILGGISTGAPIWLTLAFKPTPSIALPQNSVNLAAMENTSLRITGRHDPCVAPRAVPVVEAVTALVLMDEMLQGA